MIDISCIKRAMQVLDLKVKKLGDSWSVPDHIGFVQLNLVKTK